MLAHIFTGNIPQPPKTKRKNAFFTEGTYFVKTEPDTSSDGIKINLKPDSQVYGVGIKGCDGASILLMNQEEPSVLVYQIDIGFVENTATYIKDATGATLAQKVTPNILHCSRIRTFHVQVIIQA